jgi:virulence-associated protein VapD
MVALKITEIWQILHPYWGLDDVRSIYTNEKSNIKKLMYKAKINKNQGKMYIANSKKIAS